MFSDHEAEGYNVLLSESFENAFGRKPKKPRPATVPQTMFPEIVHSIVSCQRLIETLSAKRLIAGSLVQVLLIIGGSLLTVSTHHLCSNWMPRWAMRTFLKAFLGQIKTFWIFLTWSLFEAVRSSCLFDGWPVYSRNYSVSWPKDLFFVHWMFGNAAVIFTKSYVYIDTYYPLRNFWQPLRYM